MEPEKKLTGRGGPGRGQGRRAMTSGKADVKLTLRLTRERKDAWQAKAADAGVTLSAWVVERCEREKLQSKLDAAKRKYYQATAALDDHGIIYWAAQAKKLSAQLAKLETLETHKTY